MSSKAATRDRKGFAAAPLDILGPSRMTGCLHLDRRGRILRANALCREWLTGNRDGQIEGCGLDEWLRHGDDRKSLVGAATSGDLRSLRLRISSDAGGSHTLVGELVPDPEAGEFVGVFRLAEANVAMPAGMERSARLEALGSLTSGVAHDFNNLLTILIGNLSLVAEELRNQPRSFGKIKAARDAARRGSELIRQLLSFARQESVASKLIDPAAVIERIAPLIERALGRRIAFALDLDRAAGSVRGNSAQLESVIVNLAVNARDAIEGKGSVTLRVGSRASSAAGSERELCIEVVDDGAGIPPEVVDRVFEPFFTTKAEGGGSGLGLSMVKTYTEQFGGKLDLETGAGKGTTIRLAFPVIPESADESAAMTMPIAALPTGDEAVTVLTQDENLAAMIEQILSVLGYSFRRVANPAAARMLVGSGGPALIICDGSESDWPSLHELTAHESTPAVLWLSAMSGSAADGRSNVLHKPFSLPDLAVAVRQAIDAAT